MQIEKTNEPVTLLFSTEQKDEKENKSDPSVLQDYRIEQLSQVIENYKKKYDPLIFKKLS